MVKDPQFCIIAPTSYLDEFAVRSHTHLVLAHLVDKDPRYADFYCRMSDRGDFLMMDNSAYELKEPYSPSKLVELGQRCKAHAIVLPDYPFQTAAVTMKAADQFIPDFKAAGFKTFFVPQSKRGDIEDWISAYNVNSWNTKRNA